MKLFLIMLISIVLSVALGFAAAAWTTSIKVTHMKENLVVFRSVDLNVDRENLGKPATVDLEAGKKPEFVVTNGLVHEFGTMEKVEEFSHTFVIKITGNAAGLIKLQSTSCKCTLSDLLGKPLYLEPGEEQEVGLSWKPESYAEEFEQTAQIKTDDPDHELIELRIRGRVIQKVRPVPEVLSLAGVPTDKEASYKMRVYAYRSDGMQILSTSLNRAENADKIEINSRPLTSDELKAEKGALSGQEVEVTIKAGLPFGLTRQEILLKTNLGEGNEEIMIPLFVSPRSEVTIRGLDNTYPFLAGVNRLDMKLVSGGKAAETTLSFYANPGEDAPENIEMKVLEGETWPKGGIVARFGVARPRGRITIFPLKITIPADQHAVSLTGSQGKEVGRIVIETNLESAKRIELFVNYTVVN